LLNEIDRMASIYGRLEEQRSKKVFDEEYKPEHRLKLMAEVRVGCIQEPVFTD
jgi:hypothetical protein